MTLNTMSTLGRQAAQDGRFHTLVLPDITGQVWRDQAACTKFPAQLWDPASNGLSTEDRKRWGQAAEVCRTCPVIAECAADVSPMDAGQVRAGLLVSGKGELNRLPGVKGTQPVAEPAVDQFWDYRRDISECGSKSAQRRHQKKREKCAICRTTGEPRSKPKCGTAQARRTHRRYGTACKKCGVE